VDRYRWLDVEIFVFAILAVAGSFLFRIPPTGLQRVAVAGLRLPSLCALKNLTGIDCLTCGLTRSFIHVAHGQLAAAWASHRMGLVTFVLVAVQIPYRAWRLAARREIPRLPAKLSWFLAGALALGFAVSWIVNLVTGRAWAPI
jgi:hypothetical protein